MINCRKSPLQENQRAVTSTEIMQAGLKAFHGRFIHILCVCFITAVMITGCEQALNNSEQASLHDIHAELTPTTINIGEPARLEVRAYHGAEERALIPNPGRGREIVVRRREDHTKEIDEELSATVSAFQLTSFRIGSHEISSEEVRFIDAGAEKEITRPFPEIFLEVESSVDEEDSEYRDIHPALSWPQAITRRTAILTAAAILVITASIIIIRFLKKPRSILQTDPPVPPDEAAIRALRRLMSRNWIEHGNVEPFYVELSAIVRRYIEERFDMRAAEQTTEEFIREASASHILDTEHRKLVQDFLAQADLVKFARHRPSPEDMKSAYKSAERLILETRAGREELSS